MKKQLIDRHNSHLAQHGVDWEDVVSVVEQCETEIAESGVSVLCADIGDEHPLYLVKTGTDEEEGDRIYYATRPGRKGPSRFVIGVQPGVTTKLTVVLLNKADCWVALTAYYGEPSPVEPWDERADDEAIEFWKNHALIEH